MLTRCLQPATKTALRLLPEQRGLIDSPSVMMGGGLLCRTLADMLAGYLQSVGRAGAATRHR